MSFAAQEYLIPIAEYLEGEQHSDIRHEYLAGRVYAMAGAGRTHNLIAGNAFSLLRAVIRGTPCQAFMADMKVRVEANDAYYYPDVVVACQADDSDEYFLNAPCLIVEVLSPATEAIDRREKLIAYRTLPSLRHYLLVSQDKRQIECFTRTTDDRWNTVIIENVGILEILCDGLVANISLDEIYEDVRL
jgi:Uma2 family endonuclease